MANNGNNNGQNYAALEAGLAPAIETHAFGRVFRETTVTFATKIAEEFRSTLNLPEVDQIIVTPKVSRSYVGADDMIATIYFAVGSGKNVFYRGNKNNKNSNGRLNMVQAAGAANTGMFNTTDHFKEVMRPFCKLDNHGNALLNLKSVQGVNGVAALEVNFMDLLCLFLGIESDDRYDCMVMSVTPVSGVDGNVFSMMFMKYISDGAGKSKGKSGVNYSRIQQEQFDRINGRRGGGNNGNNNGGGRSY